MSQYVKFLVSYDINDNKLRTKFFNALKDLGLIPIQKSVFYGDLNYAESKALDKIARKMLNPEIDSCIWFPCGLSVNDLKKCIGMEKLNYVEPDGCCCL